MSAETPTEPCPSCGHQVCPGVWSGQCPMLPGGDDQ